MQLDGIGAVEKSQTAGKSLSVTVAQPASFATPWPNAVAMSVTHVEYSAIVAVQGWGMLLQLGDRKSVV